MRSEDKLDCKESQSLMAAYIDDELDSPDAIRYAAHLAGCTACTDAYRQMVDLHASIKTHGIRYSAPSHLRHRIQSALPRPAPRRKKLATLPWAWINLGVATAFTFAFALTFSLYLTVPSAEERDEQEVVDSHARSLMVNHLSDVASSDQHTVKPWFSGKLDFSPTVYDFAQQDFPLIGGRLDYLNHHPVAALAYQHRKHVLNLFVWPDKTRTDVSQQTSFRQGYHMIHWTQAGMHYWLISDMNAQDLGEFKRLLGAQIEKDGRQ
jgi:anti-sigma factor RsiW